MRNNRLTAALYLSVSLYIVTLTPAYAECPCDIYAEGGTPCVAAHSTARALFASYSGPLYQVRRTSDGALLDIGVLGPGGFVNAAMQDTFLKTGKGTIAKIYDQSENKNHLGKAPKGGFLNNGGLEADAKAAPQKVNGYQAYGVRTTMSWDNDAGAVGYRNNATKGMPVRTEPEGMYMVCDGRVYNEWCCFDYGNAQTDMKADESAIMETVYFGNSTQWGHGSGNGPWVMADLEWGVFAGGALVHDGNTSITANFVTGMVKGDSSNLYAIRAGDAQSGALKTMYSGRRPQGYHPMKKEGVIVLGLGGDNSHTGIGVFFEGAMTRGYPTDATENAVQTNIVAAGYGRNVTTVRHVTSSAAPRAPARVHYQKYDGTMALSYIVNNACRVSVNIVDQRGRHIASVVNSVMPAGRHETAWNARRVPAGAYVWRMLFDGRLAGIGKVVVGK